MFDFCNGLDFKELFVLKSFFMKSINLYGNIYLKLDLLKILAYENNYLLINLTQFF